MECEPKLRFPEFSGEWEEFKFGEYLDVKSGYGFKASEYVEEGVPLVKIDNVTYGKIKWDTITYLPNNYLEKYPELVLEEGDILLALNRPITQNKLKIGIIKKKNSPAILYQRVGKIIFKRKSVDKKFSYYNLTNQIYTFVKKSSVGSDQPFISTVELKKLKIYSPSLLEQQKIASFLSKVDSKIDLLEKKQELWETYKKGIMKQIFSQKLRFKDENGEDYPDWEEKTLNEISNINPKSEKLPEEFVYIDLESVESGVLKKQTLITKDEAPSRAQRILQNKDILYQTVRPYQRNNLIFNSTNSRIYVASTGYAQIRSKENSKFIYYVLHSDDFVNKVLARCTGTSYPAINSKDLGKIKLNVPFILEQEKVSKFISAIESKINHINTELDINNEFKKGLLQQMFC